MTLRPHFTLPAFGSVGRDPNLGSVPPSGSIWDYYTASLVTEMGHHVHTFAPSCLAYVVREWVNE